MINRYTSVANFNSNADDPCQRVNYVYDAFNGDSFGANNAWGHVAAVFTGDPSCVVVPFVASPLTIQVQQQSMQFFSYNAAGHVTQKRLQLYEQEGGDPNQQYKSWWDVSYSYNNLGQVTSTTYPAPSGSTPRTYTTGYDNMQRPAYMVDNFNSYTVAGVAYNAANQPIQTQFRSAQNGAYFWENRSYNQLNQLITVNNFNTSPTLINGANLNLTYNYTAGANNGQISSMSDNALGQTVTYAYNLRKQLIGANGTGQQVWSQTYGYDGFGNMNQKNGGAQFLISIDASTNRLAAANFCYDPDGNAVSDQNGGGCANPNYAYDIANRMVSAKIANGGTETYQYGADNKRLSKITFTPNGTGGQTISQTVYIYGAAGKKLGVVVDPYGTAGAYNNVGAGVAGPSSFYPVSNIYWSGRLVKQSTDTNGTPDNNFVGLDRLGSVINDGTPGRTFYLPYGEELTSTANDRVKFATYTRDNSTKLDYPDQRYYTNIYGRMMSADPSMENVEVISSTTWNKYTYANGGPVNLFDPTGLTACGDLSVAGTGQTVAQEVNANTAQGHFIDLVWHEAGTYAQAGSNVTAWLGEFEGIAQAIWDRYQLVSGNASVTGANGIVYGGANVGALGYGAYGSSLNAVLSAAAGGTGVLNGSGQLVDNAGDLQAALNQDQGDFTYSSGKLALESGSGQTSWVTQQCFAVIAALETANSVAAGINFNPAGTFITSWNSSAPINNPNYKAGVEQLFGNSGPTNFFGFTSFSYGNYAPRRNPGRPRRPVHPV